VIAGTARIASNIGFHDQNSVTDAQMASGPGVIEFPDRTNYQVGVVAGWVAIVGVLVAAAGWARLADRPGDDHLARRVLPHKAPSVSRSSSNWCTLLLHVGVWLRWPEPENRL